MGRGGDSWAALFELPCVPKSPKVVIVSLNYDCVALMFSVPRNLASLPFVGRPCYHLKRGNKRGGSKKAGFLNFCLFVLIA